MRSSTSSTDSSVWKRNAIAAPPDPLTGRGERSVSGAGAGGPVVSHHWHWAAPVPLTEVISRLVLRAGVRRRIAGFRVSETDTRSCVRRVPDSTRTIAGALPLSFSHSVVDGAPAARFATVFRGLLEAAAAFEEEPP